uniref:Ig-like domain-containing protein n=1 Tax=Cyprinus carpio TaxID=7962 RepID=A0A8C2IH70_CYPCA
MQVKGGMKPSVSLLPPSSLQISGDSAALLCLLSSYSPQGALVSWTLDGSEVTEGVVTSAESEQDGRYSRSSVLTLSKARWEAGELYVCRVTHDGAPHEASFHKKCCTSIYCIVESGPTVKPSVSLLPPSSLQISGDSAALLCLLSSYSPQGALVSWTLDGSEVTEGVVTSAESEQDGRYSRSSVLTLSKARWEAGELYVCRVTHDGAPHENVDVLAKLLIVRAVTIFHFSYHGYYGHKNSRYRYIVISIETLGEKITNNFLLCLLSFSFSPNEHKDTDKRRAQDSGFLRLL